MSPSLAAFRSERGADRCTPLVASVQDSLRCTFSSTFAVFAIFFFCHFILCLCVFLSCLTLSLTSRYPCCYFSSPLFLVWSTFLSIYHLSSPIMCWLNWTHPSISTFFYLHTPIPSFSLPLLPLRLCHSLL